MRPLAALVLAEFVALVVLAVLWLGGTGNAAARTVALPEGPDTARETPTAASVAASATTSSAVADAPARELAPSAPTGAIAANDALGIVLSGTIRSSDGTLVDGANVYLSRNREGHGGNSAGPGCYAIAGLQPGEWKLTCRAERYTPHEATCVLDERAFQQVDIELKQSFVVRVKVQGADGKSIIDELQQKTIWGLPYVVATEAPLAGDLPPTVQSRLIHFGLGEWKPYGGMSSNPDSTLLAQGYCGELRMNRAPPAYASLLLRTTLLQGQRIEPGQKELVFTIEAKDVLGKHGKVKLRLVDGATGNPIADASVTVRTAQGGHSFAKTDADGRASIENVVPGLGILESHQSSREQEGLFRYIRVPAGGTVDLGDITLSAQTKITGVVVDGDGKPVNGASVEVTELDGRTFPQPLVSHRSEGVDAEGKFQLWGCGRHRYVVLARVADGTDSRSGFATVDATGGAPAPLTITLAKPTTVNLNVSFDATVGRTVTALGSDRSPVAVAALGADYRPKSISLLPGSYTIEVHDMLTDRLVRSFALQVGNEPVTIDVP